MLRVRNTLTRRTEEIAPVTPGRASMYSCGPTVYRYVHVGNLRSFILADVIRRVLAYHGLEVTAVMNITDVGHMTDEVTESGRDRMELAVDDEGLAPTEIAEKYTDAFLADADAVNIRRFDHYPKATDHIPQMIELATTLLDRGHAYEIDGTVYFDVTTFPEYGKLSGHSPEDMRAGQRVVVDTAKRNHQDFTLWRAAEETRLMSWPSPWGDGYPGWHIECSAMSMHLLGERFDVHTGGVDNIFPHHEDEIAQSEAAVGHPVVSTWVHGEMLQVGGKMSKSAGNIVRVPDLVDAGYDPLAFRSLCFTGRYRRQIDYTDDAIHAADTAVRRLREHLATLGDGGTSPATDAALQDAVRDRRALDHHRRFVDALDDDLDLPEALAVLHAALSDDGVPPDVRRTLAASWDHVLGLDLVQDSTLPAELSALVEKREQARARKDFETADALRRKLADAGVDLIDTAEGTRWVRR